VIGYELIDDLSTDGRSAQNHEQAENGQDREAKMVSKKVRAHRDFLNGC
jgi:hypothetical protein